MTLDYEIKGLDKFTAAIRRNSSYVVSRANLFITRGLAEYRRIIIRNPWRPGMTGGGAPVKTGHLRDTHQQEVQMLQGRIYPTASYASYVHGFASAIRKGSYQLRPWLDYAKEAADPAIQKHEKELLDDIVHQLAT